MISNRCYYALKATLELAKRHGLGLATISEIAAAQNIPTRFLEAILLQLKQGGIAKSVRGKEGGYQLAKPPSSITVGDVIRLFEGWLFIEGGAASRSAARVHDAFHETWVRAEHALAGVFDQVTFADLAEKDRQRTAQAATNYVI